MARYKVTCDHLGCGFSGSVTLDDAVGEWVPDAVVLIDGEEVLTEWAGTPILEVYEQHHQAVHAPEKQPPMCAWELVEA